MKKKFARVLSTWGVRLESHPFVSKDDPDGRDMRIIAEIRKPSGERSSPDISFWCSATPFNPPLLRSDLVAWIGAQRYVLETALTEGSIMQKRLRRVPKIKRRVPAGRVGR